jgi:DNA polymerase-3 subunit gamma/tau
VALALYRKYRSATFAEVIGQEHVTAPLMQALSAGRINHAFLFSGPRGCGKTSSARILARSLNCVQGPTPTPCGVCDSCKDLAPNGSGSIDVIEIDAASHGGVDDARDLRERAYYAPVRDRYKVYIIDEAHMVTTQGFNALLKLVEEPPDFLIFIFATTEPDKVLQTIRSRTHHYPFRLIPPSVLRAHLERICQAEAATVEATVFPLVVRAGGGSARDSLSILDQLLAGAGAEGVTYAMAVGLLGVTDSALLDDVTDALAVGDSAAVYATIDRVVEAGHDPRRFAADLLDRFRDLVVLDSVPDAVEKGLIDYPGDQAERMVDQSRRIGTASLVRFADITHSTLTEMRGTTSPRLMLELLSARMLLPDAASDSAALLQRIERLERRQGMGISTEPQALAPAASAPAASAPAAPAPAAPTPVLAKAVRAEPAPAESPAAESAQAESVPAESVPAELSAAAPVPVVPATASPSPAAPVAEPTVAAGGADSASLRRVWPDVLEQVKARSRRTRALLDNASITGVKATVITLGATSAPIAKMIAEESNLSVLRDALVAVVGGGWTIEVGSDTLDGSATGSTTDAPAEPAGPAGPVEWTRPAAAAPSPPRRLASRDDDGVDEESDSIDGQERGGADPEAAAITLLQNSLGARPLDI